MTRLTIYRGDTRTYNLIFTDSNGDAVDITDWIVFFTVKKKSVYVSANNDDNFIIKKTVSVHTDPTLGKSQVVVSSIDSNVTPDVYHFDVQVKDNQDNIYTIDDGDFVIKADVTRRTS